MTPKVFRCSFWYLWSRFTLLAVILLFISTSILWTVSGAMILDRDHQSWLLFISSITAGVQAITVGLHVWAFSVIITPETISGFSYTLRSRRQTFPWKEINGMAQIRFVGFPCYRLTSSQQKIPILVPLFLKNIKNLEEILKEHHITPQAASKLVAPIVPSKKRASQQTLIEPIRENGYIVVTTERRTVRSR